MKIHNFKKVLRDKEGNIFMLPSILGVICFFVIPFIIILWYSCLDDPINKNFVFIDNYITLFKNNAFKLAVKNTFLFTGISVPLLMTLSLVIALLIDKINFGRKLFNSFLLSTLVIPVASIALVWKTIFHNNGVLNNIFETFGFQTIDWLKSDWGILVAILLFLWKNIGYIMVLFIAALKSIPKQIIEAAQIDGASSTRIFFRIKLAYLSPTILFGLIISIINSFKVFREVYILTGDYPYENLYLLQHFINNTFRSLDYQKLSAAAVLMCLFISLIILLLFKVDSVLGRDLEG